MRAELEKTFRATVPADDESFMIEVPFDVAKVFGRARPPVVIRVSPISKTKAKTKAGKAASFTFRWTISVYDGKSVIGIRRSHREAAGITPGQDVEISISLDREPREVEPPDDLAKLLAKSAAARASWEALSYTNKKEHAQGLLDAKKPETRERRLAKTLATLLATPPKKKPAPAKKKKPAKRA